MAYLHYAVCCDYTQINELQTLCEQCAILIQAQGFQVDITLRLAIRPDRLARFQQALTERSAGQLVLNEIKN
ncbi:DUF1949 domain-containing protein [Aggregatibacter actinomycetemcomitans]|uniref:DUF1949 domain-containing protein n=1 Tax=Aggregatibacter actinomycetemcomitans TaxID=714 RepID=UPI0027E3B27D|nr:DUF1949 domain-containing protein [Aggregatibacter actinomycetemcomitans]